jgi:hypothetical protein
MFARITARDVEMATAWCRGVHYSVLGVDDGERLFRTLPAMAGLDWWFAFRDHFKAEA